MSLGDKICGLILFAVGAVLLWLVCYGLYTMPRQQSERECRPRPGYCDIDTDYRGKP